MLIRTNMFKLYASKYHCKRVFKNPFTHPCTEYGHEVHLSTGLGHHFIISVQFPFIPCYIFRPELFKFIQKIAIHEIETGIFYPNTLLISRIEYIYLCSFIEENVGHLRRSSMLSFTSS